MVGIGMNLAADGNPEAPIEETLVHASFCGLEVQTFGHPAFSRHGSKPTTPNQRRRPDSAGCGRAFSARPCLLGGDGSTAREGSAFRPAAVDL
jgi:hypothetical protein